MNGVIAFLMTSYFAPSVTIIAHLISAAVRDDDI